MGIIKPTALASLLLLVLSGCQLNTAGVTGNTTAGNDSEYNETGHNETGHNETGNNDSGSNFNGSQLNKTGYAGIALPQAFQADNTGGQLLTAMCAQCHGTLGCSRSGFPSLERGETASELQEYISRANQYLGTQNPNTTVSIMTAQAHGYTFAEAQAIGTYLAQHQPTLSCGGGEGNEGYGDNDD